MRCLFVIACLCTVAFAATVQAKAKPGRYQVKADGTVYDTATKLTWQQVVPAKEFNWSDAKAYCTANAATLPGAGWHLPNSLELQRAWPGLEGDRSWRRRRRFHPRSRPQCRATTRPAAPRA